MLSSNKMEVDVVQQYISEWLWKCQATATETHELKGYSKQIILQGTMHNHSKRVRGSDKSLLATPTVARNKRPVRLLSFIAIMYHCFYQLVILSVAQLQALRPTIKYFYLLVLLVYPLSKLISQNNSNDSSEVV